MQFGVAWRIHPAGRDLSSADAGQFDKRQLAPVEPGPRKDHSAYEPLAQSKTVPLRSGDTG